jgi:hypothetical protein
MRNGLRGRLASAASLDITWGGAALEAVREEVLVFMALFSGVPAKREDGFAAPGLTAGFGALGFGAEPDPEPGS